MFYGWRVVAGVFVAQLFVVGFFTYAISLLVTPVRNEFGVSLEQVMFSLTAATFLGLFASPIGGVMMDRLSIRWLMAGGTVVFGAGLWLLAQVQSINAYIAVFAFTMAVSNIFAGSMCASTAISRWFTASRGRALGLSAVGVSIGGIIMPKLLGYWIEEHGWRVAMEYCAFAVFFVMLPVVVLLVRGRPGEVGLEPEPDGSDGARAAETDALTLGQILRLPDYWYLGLSLGILFSTYSSTMSNITPYVTNAGYEIADAATFLMTIAVLGLIGKLIFGIAADKASLKASLWVAQALILSGFLILSRQPPLPVMLLAACLMGLAAGGMLPVWGAMMARIFGLLSYGRAMGLMGPLITLCVMPSYMVVGRLYDSTGSYNTVLMLFSGALLLSAVLILPLRLGK